MPWIDHLVKKGAVVVYPRYEQVYSQAVLDPAVAGVRKASGRLELKGLPVLALGYSRGAALAVEYAAVAKREQVPVPDAVESVNPVPYGETSRIVDLKPVAAAHDPRADRQREGPARRGRRRSCSSSGCATRASPAVRSS